MVSGRKSDRNRKNIVFGKIPQKNLVVEKKNRSSKIFRWSKIFRSSSRKIFLTQQNIFRSKIFSTSKKNVDRFFWQSFFFVQKQVSDNFFFDLIFTCKILTAPPPTYCTCMAGPHGHVATWRLQDPKKYVSHARVWARWHRNTWRPLTKLSEKLV